MKKCEPSLFEKIMIFSYIRIILPISFFCIQRRFIISGLFRYRSLAERKGIPKEINFDILRSLLWSPREDAAVKMLFSIRKGATPRSHNFQAASECLAIWFVKSGRVGEAYYVLKELALCRGNHADLTSTRSMFSQVSCFLGDCQSGLRALDLDLECGESARATLVRANYESDPRRRLDRVNRLYGPDGPSKIRRADESSPLALSNISAARSRPGNSQDMGKVSVIFPIYNAASTVRNAVNSILSQTYDNIEVLLVDDRSTDATIDVLKALAGEDSRIRVLRQEVNGGAYRARNLGLSIASGQYITTHDSDDWSHPEKLERQIRKLHEDHALVATGSYWVRVTDDFFFTSWELRPDLMRRSFPSLMARRSVFDEIGPWDGVRISGDRELIARIANHYGKASIAWIDEGVPLAFSLAGDSSLTGSRDTHASSSKHGLRRYYREIYDYQWRRGMALGEDAQAKRVAMTPLAMRAERPKNQSFDLQIKGDLCLIEVVRQVVPLVSRHGGRIAVTHVPEVVIAKGSRKRFCDKVFPLLDLPGVSFVPYSATPDVAKVKHLRPRRR